MPEDSDQLPTGGSILLIEDDAELAAWETALIEALGYRRP